MIGYSTYVYVVHHVNSILYYRRCACNTTTKPYQMASTIAKLASYEDDLIVATISSIVGRSEGLDFQQL